MPRSLSLSSPRRSGAVGPETASLLIRSIRRLFVATRSPPTRFPDIADDVLQDIFLRIGSFADLARASSACATFRRVIADRSFLRRYRSLHPPLLLGLVHAAPADFQRAETPHPNAAAAHVLSCAAGFSFDYLPPGGWNRWEPCDVRDGRVLLKSGPERYKGVLLTDLAVCDPVFQRYFLLPPITDDLLASVQVEDHHLQCFQPALVPAGEDDDDDETSFKVIGRTYCSTKTVVFVFSRCSGSWTAGASVCWDALGLNMPAYYDETCHYAYGCFFWRLGTTGNKLLKLDMNTMEFSTVDLPPELAPTDNQRVVLAEAGEGRLAMFSHSYGSASVDYYYTNMQIDESEGALVLQRKGTVPLPSNYECSINCAAEGYIFLVGTARKGRGKLPAVCFSLEIGTLKIERVSDIRRRFGRYQIYPYFGFPVSMSPRRV